MSINEGLLSVMRKLFSNEISLLSCWQSQLQRGNSIWRAKIIKFKENIMILCNLHSISEPSVREFIRQRTKINFLSLPNLFTFK